jgi:hypothetical protein
VSHTGCVREAGSEGREPNASVAQVLQRLEVQLNAAG